MLRSEDHFLEIVDSLFPLEHEHMLVGRGDDCAVLQCPERLCMSSDLFLEDVHFRTRYFNPEDIGYKGLAVNLSDLAAAGARPLGFNMNLIWPGYLDESFCRRMLASMAELAREFDLALSGGDLSFGRSLGLAVTIWGKSPERNMLRGQGQPGDIVFIVGEVGLARCGLILLEENDPELDRFSLAVGRHLRPYPLVSQGRELTGMKEVKGLMDVSDGLARDLPRFLGPDHGLELYQDFPVHPEVRAFCRDRQKEPLMFTLRGGEDYALLGVCSEKNWEKLHTGLQDLKKIGNIVEVPGIYLKGKKLELKGFDHFEKK